MSAKTKVALVAAFGIGAALGGVGVYFALNAKYEKLLDKEVEDVRERYRKRTEKMQLAIQNLREAAEDAEQEMTLEKDVYTKHVDAQGLTDYTSYTEEHDIPIDMTVSPDSIENMRDELDKVSKEAHDRDFDVHMAEREHPEDDIPSDEDEPMTDEEELEYEGRKVTEEQLQAIRERRNPYLISYGEFLHGEPEYEKIDAMYYAGDDILVDADEEIIEPRDAAVGTEFKEAFGTEKDPRLVHVRNDCTRQDFEINYLDEKYYPDGPSENEAGVANISFSSD